MKRATLLILLVVLFVVVWPVLGQTATTAADYVIRGVEKDQKGNHAGRRL